MSSSLQTDLEGIAAREEARNHPAWPLDSKVAIVGAGHVVQTAHIPAYLANHVPIAGIFDRDAAKSEEIRSAIGLPRTYPSLDELLADADVGIVDVAVPPDSQADVVRTALRRGKHVLCQKPFGTSTAEAEELVAVALECGLELAVNAQLKHAQGLRMVAALIDAGLVGQPEFAEVRIDVATDFRAFPRLLGTEQFEVRAHSIHYLDTLRWLFGNVQATGAVAGRHARQLVKGPTRTLATLRSGIPILMAVNHERHVGERAARLVVDASDGQIVLHLGTMLRYPHGPRDVMEVALCSQQRVEQASCVVAGRWIPDAFIGPLHALTQQIRGEADPCAAAKDFIRTLHLADDLNELLRQEPLAEFDQRPADD